MKIGGGGGGVVQLVKVCALICMNVVYKSLEG